MEITFIRHGIVPGNVENRVMGQSTDESLTEQGRAGAKALATMLKAGDARFDILFSSPAKRTMETSEPIAAIFNLEIIARPELLERSAGSLTNKTWSEVAELTHGILSLAVLHANLEIDYSLYGGESPADVRRRLTAFLGEIKREYPNKRILVVTHGGVIKTMYAIYKNTEPLEPDNLSVHTFSI